MSTHPGAEGLDICFHGEGDSWDRIQKTQVAKVRMNGQNPQTVGMCQVLHSHPSMGPEGSRCYVAHYCTPLTTQVALVAMARVAIVTILTVCAVVALSVVPTVTLARR